MADASLTATPAANIDRRIFVVGCPRSGTTLVQSLLGAHPDILAFPETQFFRFLHSKRLILRALNLASLESLLRARRLAREFNRPDLRPGALSMRSPDVLARQFVSMLDQLAHDAGRTHWSEKSPGHVHHIELIERYLPDARFVHVIRGGVDTAASIRHAARTYATSHWIREYPDLRSCFLEWQSAIEESARWVDAERHTHLRYEAAVEDPQRAAQVLCDRLGIPFNASILTERAASAQAVSRDTEPWKSSTGDALQQQSSRADDVLTEQQRKLLASWVADVEVPACHNES